MGLTKNLTLPLTLSLSAGAPEFDPEGGGAPAPTVLVSDSFARADSAVSLGTADTGQVWANNITGLGPLGINGNTAYAPGADQRAAHLDAGAADGTISVTFAALGTQHGLRIRQTDNNNHLKWVESGGGFFLYKRTAGSFVTLGSTVFARAVGDVVRAVLSGTSVTCYVIRGGAIVATVGPITESDHAAVTRHGIEIEGISARLDDFGVTTP